MIYNSLSVILPSMTMLNPLPNGWSEVRTQHTCMLVRVRQFLRTQRKCLLHHVGPRSPRLPAKQTKQPSAAPGAESGSLWAFGLTSVSVGANEVQVGSLSDSSRGRGKNWTVQCSERLEEDGLFLTNGISYLLPGRAKLCCFGVPMAMSQILTRKEKKTLWLNGMWTSA